MGGGTARMCSGPSNSHVTALLRKTTLTISVAAMLWPLSVEAAPQEPAASPDAVEQVRAALNRTPPQSLKFDARMPTPAATFRVTVNARVFGLPIVDQLRKDFELTPLQRQSAEWRAKCCGYNLLALADGIETGLRHWNERRIRDRVSRELAEVIAAAEK
jgi:hypothetical protein